MRLLSYRLTLIKAKSLQLRPVALCERMCDAVKIFITHFNIHSVVVINSIYIYIYKTNVNKF